MFGMVFAVLWSLGAAFQPRRQPLLENLALRHQLLVMNRTAGQPKFRNSDRLLWICLRAVWSRWEKALVIIQPQMVIGWHRVGFPPSPEETLSAGRLTVKPFRRGQGKYAGGNHPQRQLALRRNHGGRQGASAPGSVFYPRVVKHPSNLAVGRRSPDPGDRFLDRLTAEATTPGKWPDNGKTRRFGPGKSAGQQS
jgi:hypothetical protein